MRRSVGGLLFLASLLVAGALLAQTPATKSLLTGSPSTTAAPTSAPSSPPPQQQAQLQQGAKPSAQPGQTQPAPAKCDNPNAIGLTRTVEIDTTGAPGFGFEHFKNHDFLKNGEVVLTFDDGPWPGNTEKVLKTLAEHCIKATFFPIGKHATWSPSLLKDVAAAGHSIGSHTWSHKNLEKMPLDQAKEEVEKGLAGVQWALDGAPTAPFFRFPALKHPPEVVEYLGKRNIAMFSTDFDSFDFKMRRPEQVIQSVMAKLEKHGKGIILMHDFQHATADALPELLKQMKEKGYKVVHMKPKFLVKSLPEYDALVLKEQKMPTANAQPTSSIVKTIEE